MATGLTGSCFSPFPVLSPPMCAPTAPLLCRAPASPLWLCLLCPEVRSRGAFGKLLADIHHPVAVEMDQSRLLVQKATHWVDVAGHEMEGRRAPKDDRL